MKSLFIGFLLGIFLIGMAGKANANSIQINPTVDGYAFGTLPNIWISMVSDSSELLVDNIGGTLEDRAALEFNISSLNPNDIVTAVSLDIYIIDLADENIELSGYAGDGNLTENDFRMPFFNPVPPNTFLVNHDPELPSATNPSGLNHILLGVNGINFIDSLLGSGESYAGILMRELVMNEENAFWSMEYSDSRYWPTLNIEYTTQTPVPEPATMFLLGTGLVGVAGAARRKKKNQA